MIIVKLKGGLGNQMFQYAFGYSISKDLKTRFLIDISSFENDSIRKYELSIFDLKNQISSKQDFEDVLFSKSKLFDLINLKILRRLLPYYKLKIVNELKFSYDENLKKISSNTILEGYFQSEKYFSKYRKELLKLFEITISPNLYYKNLLDLVQNNHSVSIHIRRGDYVSNSQTNVFHGLVSMEYYKNAISIINEEIKSPLFIIISDDIDWCKHEFNFIDAVYVNNNMGMDYEDLRLMQNCKHNIIANSSFSWWGAWLNKNPNKIVIAPKKWFNSIEYQKQTIDLIPETWMKI